MKYTLCSGYYKDRDFANLWVANLLKHATPRPENILILSVDNQWHPIWHPFSYQWCLRGNLGHVGALIDGTKDREICGWSAAIMTLAMASYANETDMIYLESDCLAFGKWVEQIYKDLGDGDFVFGHQHQSEPWMECSQSLFLVRHRFIPAFVSDYISFGDERHKDLNGHEDNLPERKFVKLEQKYGPEKVKRLSFGVDRCRPLPLESPVWYAQRFTAEELDTLREKGLL